MIEKLEIEVRGQTRVDLLVALKDLLFILHEISRKEWVGDESRPN